MTKNIRLRAHLFNTTVLPALNYASETWTFRKQEENAISIIERGIERVMLGVTHFTQVKEDIQSTLLRHRLNLPREGTGQPLCAIGKNGSITGARSIRSMNNGSTDDRRKCCGIGDLGDDAYIRIHFLGKSLLSMRAAA
ncbi:hypothetical protein RB195_025133 [Necator americanus]|uniref:Uncharacterized protein n=1 Tax=Necator americanus TaxID=51031 RepID=A0ABR1ER02_NECAM